MDYPLKLTFKLFTLAPQLTVVDQQENLIFCVRQKLFKLKEDIGVFSDEQRTNQLYSIRADRIIDFSARYHFRDPNSVELGSVKRKGLRSIWKAHYDIAEGTSEMPTFTITEENSWVKVFDSLFSEIPIVGLFTGYVFNPKYLVTRVSDGTVVMRLEKVPAFLSRIFTIKKVDQMKDNEEVTVLLSVLMMMFLERARG